MDCRFLLEEEGMSVYECSRRSGIPYSTLSDLLRGKTAMENISFRNAYALARTLEISMEDLYDRTRSRDRIDFELFKSNVCHRLKELGDLDFITRTIEENPIMEYYNRKWYPECLYQLAMLDYVSKENGIELCSEYDEIRTMALTELIYPASVIAMSLAANNDVAKKKAVKNAIPEFLKYNIVESDIRNVI